MKDLNNLPSAWQPELYERDLYQMWEEAGAFQPNLGKKRFSIIMPPPNANGDLHIGHGLMYAIQDLFIRFHRLQGEVALWLPGADHAGFETQIVFEKKLLKEGKSRFDFDRQGFYQAVYDFTIKNKVRMEEQGKRLGGSCDWSRNLFTLDPRVIKIVYKTFKKLFDDGLVYREERLVNYCVKHQTAFSDLEVEHEEKEGTLWYLKYPLKDGGVIEVATTRPETMLGDTAVAVHPQDKRYQKLIGRSVILPLANREIPVVADESVDPKFGTGAVKVTPAHDEKDFEIGKRHKLPRIQVIGFDGRITKEAPAAYQGLKILQAREKVLEDLKNLGLLVKALPHKHIVGVCYKCRTPIEPLPLSQWFIKIEPLKKPAILAVEKEEILFIPKRFKKIALFWLKNFHDWNISRQIWWGIAIPAFHCPNHPDYWLVTEDGKPPKATCPHCSSPLVQDPDTFDTWFSSSQWPFVTLLANKKDDFERFYPTSVMETMYDILPFWVCRMIMMGLYVTGKVPFKTVYIHGMVKDALGKKMSKSKGNVINPEKLIERYGADALRFAYVFSNPPGADMALSEEKVKAGRNFANKIWNASRFLIVNLNQTRLAKSLRGIRSKPPQPQSAEQKKILEELKTTKKKTEKYLSKYQPHLALETLYQFFWHSFCDRYIEKAKLELKEPQLKTSAAQTLLYVLAESLVMLHPFMPFISEAVWQKLRMLDSNLEELLITALWERKNVG